MSQKPFKTFVTFDHFYNYPASSTGSTLCDAVAEALLATRYIRSYEIARYLCVDQRKLSGALELLSGISLTQLVRSYRLHQVQQYLLDNPSANHRDAVAAFGFSSESVLSDLFRRECLGTVDEFIAYVRPMLEAGLTENRFILLRPDGNYAFRFEDHAHNITPRLLKAIQTPWTPDNEE